MRPISIGALLAVCLVTYPGASQTKGAAAGPERTRQILINNARALETRGRPDMAIQVWQQVLLSDPNNVQALEGLARDYRLGGSLKESQQALDKLRAVKPDDPNIAKIEAMSSTHAQVERLREAGDLAKQGKNEEAMRIYRELYGDHPPEDVALAYYQTLYGTPGGKAQAIAAMRSLAAKSAGDARIAIGLGTMLTYDPHTRAEGIRILEAHAQDPAARTSLRQALLWDAANPTSAAELRRYLQEHPQDTEIAGRLKADEAKLAEMNAGMARTPEERAAFAALNAHRLNDAETRFMALLRKDPANSRAAAGMGFVRMQQNNFGGAISYFSQAKDNGYKVPAIEKALTTSRFWYTMGEAAQALDENQFDTAAAKYREALTMKPGSPEAMNGMAGLLMKQQEYGQAASAYQAILHTQPSNADAWRGLFLAYAHNGEDQKALAVADGFTPAMRQGLAHDPEYLRTLANLYQVEGRAADAQRTLAQALSLPFPDNGRSLSANTRLQYAGILMDAHRYDQAAEMYTRMLNDDPNDVSAWMGLVSAHHQLGQDETAIADVEKMPPAAYEAALADPGFMPMLAAIYQQAGRLDVAQGLLERAAKVQSAGGKQPSVQLQLQLASVYLQNNNTAQAYGIYRQVLNAHPTRTDAWKGLIDSLQATHRSSEALQQIAVIPTAVRRQLENDIEFVQTEAGIYAATGDNARAAECMNRVQAHYAQMHMVEPPDVAIQEAWLLYNTRNDRALYNALMNLGGRQDLSIAQRETVQTIWANWSVQRASAAMENNDSDRAVAILESTSEAFPDNLTVKKVLAGGYLKTGRAKEALAIYKSVPMDDASAADYQGAIGAALAANDRAQAEAWLRDAMERYPRDYAILGMAAKFEEARGDKQRAAAYWRAAIAAMPKASSTAKLAHELDYPETDNRPHKARTAAQLQQLLDPNNEPFQRTTKLPPLPSYGPDPYNGTAPVQVITPQPLAQEQPTFSVPATTQVPAVTPPAESAPVNPTPAPRKPKSVRKGAQSGPESYTGTMHLPPSEENISSTQVAPELNSQVMRALPPLTGSQSTAAATSSSAVPTGQQRGLRLSSQPMNSQAAQVQAMFAEQTDGQLTQGTAAQIHTLGNAPVYGPSAGNAGNNAAARYAPPAVEANARASAASPTQGHKVAKAAARVQTQSVPTLATAPSGTQPQATAAPEVQALPQQSPSAPSATDQDLQQQSLPPLRGPWIRVQRQRPQASPREEAEQSLASLEGSYSGWMGGTGGINYRSGDLGYDHLSILEAPFELSAPLGYQGRVTIIGKPVFLDSGQADGNSVIQVQEASTAGRALLLIPQPLGTDTNTGISATTSPNSTPPPQQNASGVGGELQLAFPHLAIAGGYTPYGFLVSNWTARGQWKPGNGPITLSVQRDSVKDSQLSYGGLRDPGTASLAYPGTIWGGVMTDQGSIQFSRGDAQSGYYFGVGGQYLSGLQVLSNNRVDGTAGAYWRAWTAPEYGTLTIGANFFGMHYAHNENAYTFGMGGYFSPQAYFLASIPFHWVGHSGTHLHYDLQGGVGVQAFQEDETPLFPFAAQRPLEISLNSAAIPALTSVGPNYNLRSDAAYQISPHWFAGGFLTANNTRNYAQVSAGFSIHYMFRTQPSTVMGPTGLFPNDGLRPFSVP